MSETVYLYPVWVRIWHFINAILCLLLIITGLSMQYAGAGNLLIRFDLAVSIHNVAGIILSINYVFFIIGNLMSDNGYQYNVKRKNFFKNLLVQMRFYTIGIFKKEETPFPITKSNKFNPLQRITYVLATYVSLSVLVITGWLYFFPAIIPDAIFGVSGVLINALLHVTFGFFISVFLIIHIYFSTIGVTPGSNFISIISGWHRGH